MLLRSAFFIFRVKIAPNLVYHAHLALLKARTQAQFTISAESGIQLTVQRQVRRVQILLGRASLDELLPVRLASQAIVPAAVHELSDRARRVLESDRGSLRVERLHGDS